MKRSQQIGFAFASGLLLWAAWPMSPFTILIFVSWIPLLWLETKVESRKTFFWLSYITMVVWNIATTWWIWNASAPGAVSAFLANSLIMCFPWLGFKIVKKRMGDTIGYLSLVIFWMCFEYIHLHDWGLSWPWLTLGNAFATKVDWVQWYEYTGTSGGSLWIWIVNIIFFLFIKNYYAANRKRSYRLALTAIVCLFLPLLISNLLTFNPKQGSSRDTHSIVVVQPNIDPYEKVSDATGSFEAQLQKLISLSDKQIDAGTTLVIWPETALYNSSGIDEASLKGNYFLNPLWAFLQRHPQVSLFTGIESFKQVPAKTSSSATFDGQFFESYNGSMVIDSGGARSFYHKSMLVPGVETLPWFLKFIAKWFEKFGGTAAGYTKQNERTVLEAKGGFRIAPSICYESIYGEFMSRYVHNGANLICIITNDGWWKKTPGHKQHMSYARLRAIETRTWVARSANTGISCFIDPSGKVINPQPYDTMSAIRLPISPNDKKTFFVRHGDIVSKLMAILSIIIVLVCIVLKIQKKVLYKS